MRMIMDINYLWNRIIELEGEVFHTITGLEFTYKVVNDHEVVPYRDGSPKWKLSKDVFKKALEFSKFSGEVFNQKIIGSSYVAGILNDYRIGIK